LISDGFGKVSKSFLLVFAELGWDFDLDRDVEISLRATGKRWYAFITNAESGSTLSSCWDFDGGLAIEGWDFKFASKSCGAERKWNLAK
jgi:hypothetical protein